MPRLQIITADALTGLRQLEAESVQCIVTSPPYWGLRDYGVEGQIGLEKTPEAYVAALVEIFREVWRVLRNDGTLWLNLGDSYAGHDLPGWRPGNEQKNGGVSNKNGVGYVPGMKPKDLVGIPWMVAFALRADGWYLRRDIIWSKPNNMPESVTDRPTTSHEYIFLLTKSEKYFFDSEAVKERQTASTVARSAYGWHGRTDDNSKGARTGSTFKKMVETGEAGGTIPADGLRNIRSVWTIPTRPFTEAHFAVFPPEIPRKAILAGTSEKGACGQCGTPWARIVEKTNSTRTFPDNGKGVDERKLEGTNRRAGEIETRQVGWRPGCACGGYRILSTAKKAHRARAPEARAEDDVPQFDLFAQAPAVEEKTRPRFQKRISEARLREYRRRWQERIDNKWPATRPCVVLDCFAGSGTTGKVAIELGRSAILIEPKPEYVEMIEKRCTTTIGLPLQ